MNKSVKSLIILRVVNDKEGKMVIGACSECGNDVTDLDNLSEIGHAGIFECGSCGYPNLLEELLDRNPNLQIRSEM